MFAISYYTFSIPLISHRCSGDFSQCKQSKYVMGLPGLPDKMIQELLGDDLNAMERLVASQPGMYGRIWYGQGLAFDEAYQILQDMNVFSLV